jgi:hypothetical protein
MSAAAGLHLRMGDHPQSRLGFARVVRVVRTDHRRDPTRALVPGLSSEACPRFPNRFREPVSKLAVTVLVAELELWMTQADLGLVPQCGPITD